MGGQQNCGRQNVLSKKGGVSRRKRVLDKSKPDARPIEVREQSRNSSCRRSVRVPSQARSSDRWPEPRRSGKGCSSLMALCRQRKKKRERNHMRLLKSVLRNDGCRLKSVLSERLGRLLKSVLRNGGCRLKMKLRELMC